MLEYGRLRHLQLHMRENKGNLSVSEHFYTLQCEGVTNGMPAYFIRLKGCNLMCGGSSGSLMQLGKATWWCDSEPIWRIGRDYSYEEMENAIKENGQLERILNGDTNIVWTGGEPTRPSNMKSIIEFTDYLRNKYPDNQMFTEIETNGTITTPTYFFDRYIDQINCSPKLANSGMPLEHRYNPEQIERIKNFKGRGGGWFKFVVSEEKDMDEIFETYINPHQIPHKQIVLMPGLDKQEDYFERTKFVYELGKQYNMRAVSRGHIAAWDRTTGV